MLDISNKQITNFLSLPEIKSISEKFYLNKTEQANSEYNIFSIVSENYHYENYHSDILKYLLTVDIHKNKELFNSFIDTLNTLKGEILINKSDYDRYSVRREYPIYKTKKNTKGSIDILIYSEEKKHAIIIENKINNAKDQHQQLNDYYQEIENEKYTIDAVVYLSFDGKKRPDNSEGLFETVKEKLIFLSAGNTEKSIFSWLSNFLNPLRKDEKHSDLYTFIYQYVKLLTHLKGEIMNDNLLEEFYYQVKNNTEKIQTAYAVRDIVNGFDKFLLEKVKKDLEKYLSKSDVIKDQYTWTYLRYEKNKFTVDICRNSEKEYLDQYIIFFFSENIKDCKSFKEKHNLEFDDGTIFDKNWFYCKYFYLSEYDKMIDFLKLIFEII